MISSMLPPSKPIAAGRRGPSQAELDELVASPPTPAVGPPTGFAARQVHPCWWLWPGRCSSSGIASPLPFRSWSASASSTIPRRAPSISAFAMFLAFAAFPGRPQPGPDLGLGVIMCPSCWPCSLHVSGPEDATCRVFVDSRSWPLAVVAAAIVLGSPKDRIPLHGNGRLALIGARAAGLYLYVAYTRPWPSRLAAPIMQDRCYRGRDRPDPAAGGHPPRAGPGPDDRRHRCSWSTPCFGRIHALHHQPITGFSTSVGGRRTTSGSPRRVCSASRWASPPPSSSCSCCSARCSIKCRGRQLLHPGRLLADGPS